MPEAGVGSRVAQWARSRRAVVPAQDQRAARAGVTHASVMALLETTPDGLVGFDLDGGIVFLNAAAERLLGYCEADVLGLSAVTLLPELAGAVDRLRTAALAGRRPGEADACDLFAVAKDGTPVPVSARLAALPSAHGWLVIATLRDESERFAGDVLAQRLQDDLDDARATVSALLDAIKDRAALLVDADGCVTTANRAAERLLGYRRAELVGVPTQHLSLPEELDDASAELGTPPGLDPLLELTRSGLPNTQDWTWVTRDGQPRPVTLQITPIGDRNEPAGFVLLATDRRLDWQPITSAPAGGGRLLVDLDDVSTRVLRWQVGGSRSASGRRP